jgi:hypothetical protein
MQFSVKSDLKNFYNNQAKKYSDTRKKYRSDSKYILDEINIFAKMK